jgi:hypothetical protein
MPRRTNANSVHSSGVCAGVSGLPVIDGPKPTNPSSVETTPVTMFSGASGPLNGAGTVWGTSVCVGVAAKVFGDEDPTGAARLKAATLGLNVVSDDRRAVGDGSVEMLLLEIPCGINDVGAGNEAFRDGVLGLPSISAANVGD